MQAFKNLALNALCVELRKGGGGYFGKFPRQHVSDPEQKLVDPSVCDEVEPIQVLRECRLEFVARPRVHEKMDVHLFLQQDTEVVPG